MSAMKRGDRRARTREQIVCRRAVELVTDYLEGALTSDERARFEAHLAGCPHCTEYLREMRVTIAALGRVEPEALSPAARDDLVALYRGWRAE
jgi:anti-sigma factor RsiW